MKMLINSAAIVATLLAGTAAFAEGGRLDGQAYLNASDHAVFTSTSSAAKKSVQDIEVNELGQNKILSVTTFEADADKAQSALAGR